MTITFAGVTMFKIHFITIQAYDRYFIIVQMYIVFHYFQVVKTKYYMCAINIRKICEPHPQIFIITDPCSSIHDINNMKACSIKLTFINQFSTDQSRFNKLHI